VRDVRSDALGTENARIDVIFEDESVWKIRNTADPFGLGRRQWTLERPDGTVVERPGNSALAGIALLLTNHMDPEDVAVIIKRLGNAWPRV
jgi:hypothetical protein